MNGSSLQRRLNELTKVVKKPSFGVERQIDGKLLLLIDGENPEIPDALYRAISSNPGVLYGSVLADNGKTYHLSFAESPEAIYSIYGDASLLANRRVRIKYYDGNIHLGHIYILPKQMALANNIKTTITFDIGGIL